MGLRAPAVGPQIRIKADTDTTPQNCEFRGEYFDFGGERKRVFYERERVSRKVAVIDPYTQGPMYKKGPAGVTLNKVHTRREYTGEVNWREFILVDCGTGKVEKHYNFRESAEEIARRAKVRRRQENMERFLDYAEEAGGVDALLAKADEDEPDIKPEVTYPLKAPGKNNWKLSNGEVVQCSEKEAAELEATLHPDAA